VPCRGIRGATTVETSSATDILEATRQLLAQIVEANGIEVADIASAFFTATPDLTDAFPAQAARDLGWQQVPLQGRPGDGNLSEKVLAVGDEDGWRLQGGVAEREGSPDE
jgi:hypothetical protein